MAKKLNLDVTDIRRLYHDLNGLDEMSLQEIVDLRAKAKHIFPDPKTYYYNTREEGFEQYYKRFAQWYMLRKELDLLDCGLMDPRNRVLTMAKYALDSGSMTLHYFAFIPAIEMLGNKEQRDYWVQKANRIEITGAYVQTELGHGSDVMSLETTATYDAATKEFVINTPSLSATKFWPGGLGKTANHCVLYARLISQGQDHGVNAFII